MKAKGRFPDEVLAELRERKGLRIRAGNGRHRFIGIWAVVVRGRVFARSWSVKPDGWYRSFLKEQSGAVQIGEQKFPVRAVRVRGTHTRDAIDRAYLETYNSKGAIKYAQDLGSAKSRATTVELVPPK